MSTQSKHTPGPWIVKADGYSIGLPSDTGVIAETNTIYERGKADAQLIAAAPDLLAMLKAANHALYVVGKPSALKAAMAGSADLIRKAEGRA